VFNGPFPDLGRLSINSFIFLVASGILEKCHREESPNQRPRQNWRPTSTRVFISAKRSLSEFSPTSPVFERTASLQTTRCCLRQTEHVQTDEHDLIQVALEGIFRNTSITRLNSSVAKLSVQVVECHQVRFVSEAECHLRRCVLPSTDPK
jgi:hypothetical protein